MEEACFVDRKHANQLFKLNRTNSSTNIPTDNFVTNET